MKRVIATDRPIRHGNITIRKSLDSLSKLIGLDSLSINQEHTDKVLGQAKDFMLRVRNGVTEVLAEIPDNLAASGKGFSLQFSGLLSGDEISINKFHHLALTENPRDVLTLSESEEGDAEVIEQIEPEAETEKPKEEVKAEFTADQLTALLENPQVQARLLSLLSVQVEKEETTKEPEPKEQPEEDPKPEPIRVVVKPRVAEPVNQMPSKPRVKPRTFTFPAL